MRNKNLSVLIVCLMCLLIPNEVLAHPGRTDSRGCHVCKTNCAKWGLKQGEYHCHGGGTYANSQNNVNDYQFIPNEVPKSSDNTLKSITIDGENIEVSDQMNYKTKKEKIDIVVETNDKRAHYNIYNNSLNIGINTINIKVTAENGNEKNYSLLVNREKLSNNTNIKVIINNKKIKFNHGKSNINVSSDTINLQYKYELEDKNSQVKVDGDKDLKFGENVVNFTVTAEDGTEVKYELTVNKNMKTNEIVITILGLLIMSSVGYGVYYFIKKIK